MCSSEFLFIQCVVAIYYHLVVFFLVFFLFYFHVHFHFLCFQIYNHMIYTNSGWKIERIHWKICWSKIFMIHTWYGYCFFFLFFCFKCLNWIFIDLFAFFFCFPLKNEEFFRVNNYGMKLLLLRQLLLLLLLLQQNRSILFPAIHIYTLFLYH